MRGFQHHCIINSQQRVVGRNFHGVFQLRTVRSSIVIVDLGRILTAKLCWYFVKLVTGIAVQGVRIAENLKELASGILRNCRVGMCLRPVPAWRRRTAAGITSCFCNPARISVREIETVSVQCIKLCRQNKRTQTQNKESNHCFQLSFIHIYIHNSVISKFVVINHDTFDLSFVFAILVL